MNENKGESEDDKTSVNKQMTKKYPPQPPIKLVIQKKIQEMKARKCHESKC